MLTVFLNLTEKLGRFRSTILFITSGCIAAVVQFGALYIFVDWFHIWYLIGAALAFMCSFFVSFLLQKFITFVEHAKERIPRQLILYFIFALLNLGINTLIMYIEVDYLYLHYLVAQFFSSGIIAFYSYFVYKYFIFFPKEENYRN